MPAPVKKTISSTVLESIDVRVGAINLAEDIKKSKHLVRLAIAFGDHERDILTGPKLEKGNPNWLRASNACSSSILNQ